jgi:F0F1-type ATP synthase assembly protein I
VPLLYVIVGVTAYCAMMWVVAIVGLGAGMKAIFPAAKSVADAALKTRPAEAKEAE